MRSGRVEPDAHGAEHRTRTRQHETDGLALHRAVAGLHDAAVVRTVVTPMVVHLTDVVQCPQTKVTRSQQAHDARRPNHVRCLHLSPAPV